MNASEIITAITLHLLVPAAGVAVYLLLCRRLLAAGASLLFLAQLFLLFVCYGGLLLTRTPLLKKDVLRGEFGVMGVCDHNPDSARRTKR